MTLANCRVVRRNKPRSGFDEQASQDFAYSIFRKFVTELDLFGDFVGFDQKSAAGKAIARRCHHSRVQRQRDGWCGRARETLLPVYPSPRQGSFGMYIEDADTTYLLRRPIQGHINGATVKFNVKRHRFTSIRIDELDPVFSPVVRVLARSMAAKENADGYHNRLSVRARPSNRLRYRWW